MKTEKNPKDGTLEDIALSRKKIREENKARCKKRKAYFEECRAERIANIRKRHAFLSEIVKDHVAIENFACEKREFFEMMGIDLDYSENCVSLYFNMDYNEYEQFYVELSKNGGLEVSPIVDWQNEVCANERLNIFTGERID